MSPEVRDLLAAVRAADRVAAQAMKGTTMRRPAGTQWAAIVTIPRMEWAAVRAALAGIAGHSELGRDPGAVDETVRCPECSRPCALVSSDGTPICENRRCPAVIRDDTVFDLELAR